MRFLLDTHTLLWFFEGNDLLPEQLKAFIRNPANACYVSIASLWAITIKISLGKLEVNVPMMEFFSFLERNQFWILAIELEHLLQLQQLPVYQKDPFDRLIIAQAMAENLPVATKDQFFSQYGLTTQW